MNGGQQRVFIVIPGLRCEKYSSSSASSCLVVLKGDFHTEMTCTRCASPKPFQEERFSPPATPCPITGMLPHKALPGCVLSGRALPLAQQPRWDQLVLLVCCGSRQGVVVAGRAPPDPPAAVGLLTKKPEKREFTPVPSVWKSLFNVNGLLNPCVLFLGSRAFPQPGCSLGRAWGK